MAEAFEEDLGTPGDPRGNLEATAHWRIAWATLWPVFQPAALSCWMAAITIEGRTIPGGPMGQVT